MLSIKNLMKALQAKIKNIQNYYFLLVEILKSTSNFFKSKRPYRDKQTRYTKWSNCYRSMFRQSAFNQITLAHKHLSTDTYCNYDQRLFCLFVGASLIWLARTFEGVIDFYSLFSVSSLYLGLIK